MLLKTILASKSDKKVTITNGEMRKLIGNRYYKEEVTVWFKGVNPIEFKKTRKGATWYAKSLLPKQYAMPKVGDSVYHDIQLKDVDKKLKKVTFKKATKLSNEIALSQKYEYEYFTLIRKWADDRGLYEKGDAKTQFLKLQEETGELAKALLKDDRAEIIDAIGDIVVVLTNLTQLTNIKVEREGDIYELRNLKIEDCIKSAYHVIRHRKGSMKNGTFVKNEK